MFTERLKEARKAKGLSQAAAAKKLFISQPAYARYESGTATPSPETLSRIADLFGVTVDFLLEREKEIDDIDIGETLMMPVTASIRAGFDGLAEEYENELAEIPARMLRGYKRNEVRVIRVKGNSMYPQLCNGDLVVIHDQSSVDPGDIAVVIYNGEEATIKRVNYVYGEDWLELIPANPEFMTRRIKGVDLEQCRVIGKVLSLIRNF